MTKKKIKKEEIEEKHWVQESFPLEKKGFYEDEFRQLMIVIGRKFQLRRNQLQDYINIGIKEKMNGEIVLIKLKIMKDGYK